MDQWKPGRLSWTLESEEIKMAKKKDLVIGNKIVAVRPMTKAEMNEEYWDGPVAVVLVLDNGTKLYASCDDEGNRPGALFGKDENGKSFSYPRQYVK